MMMTSMGADHRPVSMRRWRRGSRLCVEGLLMNGKGSKSAKYVSHEGRKYLVASKASIHPNHWPTSIPSGRTSQEMRLALLCRSLRCCLPFLLLRCCHPAGSYVCARV